MATRTEIPQPVEAATAPERACALTSIHEVNERCLELLVHAARSEPIAPSSLIAPIRDLLLATTPETRKRSAARAFLLVELEFGNPQWWTAVRKFPDKQFRGGAWRNPFPRRSAVPLTRAILMLAWQAIRADRDTACVALGINYAVTDLIGSLQITEIDRIADCHHKHLEPRWANRPAIWHALLLASAEAEPAAMSRLDSYGLQVLTGEICSMAAAAPQSVRAIHPHAL